MLKNSVSIKRLIAASFALIFFLCVIFSGCNANNNAEEKSILRLHVRANSDSEQDQNVKMLVKDDVVVYLEKLLKNVTSVDDAKAKVEDNRSGIEAVCNATLTKNGKNYSSRVKVGREYFPTRSYENVIVQAGVYDAVIIELGSGEGANWWCVIYPPLCFVRSEDEGVRYRSRIAELWRRFFS